MQRDVVLALLWSSTLTRALTLKMAVALFWS